MKKVLKIISKQEFTSLYRFGLLPKDPNRIIVEDERSDSFHELFIERLLELPYFSGDEEYLLIGFIEPKEEKNTIEIEDLIEVIPLTEAAKVSYEQKFDSRIVFQPARFEDLVTEVEIQIDVNDKIRGAEALNKIFKTEDQSAHNLQNEDVDFAMRARRSGQKSSEFQNSFDAHLLAYDRYELFPNTDLGYFYDVGEVFAHSIGKPTFKGSGFYQFLESIKEFKRETPLSKLIDLIEESEEIAAFKSKCVNGDLKQYLAGVLFLMFKDELTDKESIFEAEIKKKVDYILMNKPYKDELRHALNLTGIFYGYNKFYSDLYELEALPIFGGRLPHSEKIDGSTEQQISKRYEDTVVKNEDQGKSHPEIDNVVGDEDAVSTAKTDINDIRSQIIEILQEQSGNKIKIVGDDYKTFKTILAPIIDIEKPKKADYMDVLKKKFNDISDIKNNNELHLKSNTELNLNFEE